MPQTETSVNIILHPMEAGTVDYTTNLHPQTSVDNVVGLSEELAEKQDNLTAGSNIIISNDTISAGVLTISEIDFIYNGGYSITANITDGTVVGVDKIIYDPVQITIIPNSLHDIPSTVTVTNADYAYDNYTGVVTLSNPTGNVIVTATCPIISVDDLESTSWDLIKQISDVDLSLNYFAVGDTKSIVLNGTIGTLELNNYTTYVYIIDFNHNSAVEGTGISFSGFKTAGTSGIDVALCDSHIGSISSDGSKWFNMNHSANTNAGGWKGCDLRYDILGSVEAKGQQNATSAATSSPVANTLMAALPSDLRAVLKGTTKYTDNIGGGTDTAANVTSTIDYLFLLAEYEVFGVRSYANSTEQNYQVQYAYYVGSSNAFKKKRNHSLTSSVAYWWERSPYASSTGGFCMVDDLGSSNITAAVVSQGLSPAFVV